MEEYSCDEDKTGRTNMDLKKYMLWGVIAILAIAVFYVLFLSGGASSNVAAPASQAAVQSSGMVGGC